MDDGIELLQGVVVFDVVVEDADLHVDIYGGESNACGSVRFTFPERDERAGMVKLLRKWCRDRTPLTFVSSGSTIALQNDRAVFADQLDPALP